MCGYDGYRKTGQARPADGVHPRTGTGGHATRGADPKRHPVTCSRSEENRGQPATAHQHNAARWKRTPEEPGLNRAKQPLRAAVPYFAVPANTWIAARQKAGRSSGLRLVTRFRSTTTTASTQSAPALTTSSLMAKKLVALRPFNMPPAEHNTHGPWQMEATSFPAASICCTNWLAFAWRRMWSGAYPPGTTTPSKSAALASS